ncbi:MAG: DNA polymerase Y family protein [Candidatus Korobacteraceae bacterium]
MFASIYIPDFPVEAIVRAEPLLREHAVAVLEGKPPLVRVMALNEKARQLGMEIGMTKLQAAVFSRNPSSTGDSIGLVILRQRSREQELSAHAALLDVAHAFTPRVEDTASDTLLLDLVGLDRLYGAPAKMAGDLASRVIAVGIEANIAIAASPDAALNAALGFSGTTIIPAGSEAQRLGVLPLQVLLDGFEISSQQKVSGEAPRRQEEKLREQMLDTLERWGVRDFRTLALLPEHALASRLGETGAKLRKLARGEGMRTLVLCAPSTQFEEAMELESPVETIESLSFVLNRLLEQLCARLEARALATHELRLRLRLERRVADEETVAVDDLKKPGSHNVVHPSIFKRTLCLPVSMRDSKVFLKLLQLELAAHPPGAPVIKLWITAEPTPPRTAQRGLFLPVTPEPERLEITLARISSIVGERRAGIARLLDSHRRESFCVDRFALTASSISHIASPTLSDTNNHIPLSLRILRPARPLQVYLSVGRPNTLISEKQSERTIQGKVLWSAGPWRSSGDWWTEKMKQDVVTREPSGPWDREEWDIALTLTNIDQETKDDGRVALYRIYRDVATGNWFADAIYD